jgi:hypothetical protein
MSSSLQLQAKKTDCYWGGNSLSIDCLALGLLLESRRGYDGDEFLPGSHHDFERNFCERCLNRILREMVVTRA